MPGVPALPFVSRFPETNLRTYVRDPKGGERLWFLSLDVESLPTVVGARLGLAVPYLPALMRVQAADTVVYQSITEAAGLPPPDHEPVVHYAPGVDARLGLPRLV